MIESPNIWRCFAYKTNEKCYFQTSNKCDMCDLALQIESKHRWIVYANSNCFLFNHYNKFTKPNLIQPTADLPQTQLLSALTH